MWCHGLNLALLCARQMQMPYPLHDSLGPNKALLRTGKLLLISSPPCSHPLVLCPLPQTTPQRLLTFSRAKAPGCRDGGERGTAVHGTEVMLHVGAHVWVVGIEG